MTAGEVSRLLSAYLLPSEVHPVVVEVALGSQFQDADYGFPDDRTQNHAVQSVKWIQKIREGAVAQIELWDELQMIGRWVFWAVWEEVERICLIALIHGRLLLAMTAENLQWLHCFLLWNWDHRLPAGADSHPSPLEIHGSMRRT